MLNLSEFLRNYTFAGDDNETMNCYGMLEKKAAGLQIRFECEGGCADLRLQYHVNIDNLDPNLKKEVLALIEESRLFEQQHASETKVQAASDVVYYKLTLADGEKRQSLECNDVTAAPSVRPLLSLLKQLALEEEGK